MNTGDQNLQDARLEAELHSALRRVDAPAELQARFYAIADEIETERTARGGGIRAIIPRSGGFVFALPRFPLWFGGAVATALVAGVFVAGDAHIRHARQSTEATRQFELAQQIESRTLAQVSAQIAQTEPSLQTN